MRYTFSHLYGYVCSSAVSTLVLLLQLGFLKWYGNNRYLTVRYYVGMLWLWESLKLFLAADDIVQFTASLACVRCILISLIHQVPFCMHLHPRMCAFGGQILATISRGNVEGTHILLLSIAIGHLVGLMLAYRLDLRARTAFVQSLPKYLLDGSNGNGPGEQFSSYRASFSRQMWSIFYPELFEKSEYTDHVGSVTSERSAPHRALGGFAGGFGGVSGLKCANFATAAPLSSSSNSLGGLELSNSSDDENFADSGFLEPQIPHGLRNSTQQHVTHGGSQSSTSACSKADSDWNRSKQHQAQRRRGF
ncbi:hypothetical protein O6H91_Y501100 [Diphasiastrum complanatum]|nr:hypothetical protein O6H91_Y501100 [Diphasiastrum complanatum]